MARIIHGGDCFIVYISLFLVISYSKYSGTSETSTNPQNHSIPTPIPKPGPKTNKSEIATRGEIYIHDNSNDSNINDPKFHKKISTKLEIQSLLGGAATCGQMKTNGKFLLNVEKNNCQIFLDNLDENSMMISKYLDTFCRQDQHFYYRNKVKKIVDDASNVCELTKRNGDKYIISTKNSNISLRSDLLLGICEHLKLWNSTKISNDSGSLFCISISEYFLESYSKKCCVRSFRFIPKGALKVDAVMMWIEKDGYSYLIQAFYFLSTICLCIIFISGLVSRRYRSERGNQILIHFAFSIFAQFVLHMIVCSIGVNLVWCDLPSIIAHYFTLVESCWTSIIAYLQFKRFVKVFDNEPNHLIFKLCVIAYIFPILPVTLWIIYNDLNEELVNYLTFGLPEFAILVINSALLILITRNIVFVKNEYIEHKKSLTMEVKLIFFLFFVLDFSWFDIILAHLTSSKIFIYLFLLTQSLQGFMLFFVFGIMNDHNRFIYKKFLMLYLKKILRR